jgi:hypothetical protein
VGEVVTSVATVALREIPRDCGFGDTRFQASGDIGGSGGTAMCGQEGCDKLGDLSLAAMLKTCV